MATKSFTTNFSLNRSQSVGLDRAISKAQVVEADDAINVKFYGKDDTKILHQRFDDIFNK